MITDDTFEYIGRITRPDGTVADESTTPRAKPKFWFGLAAGIWLSRHPDYIAELFRRPKGSDEVWQIVERKPKLATA